MTVQAPSTVAYSRVLIPRRQHTLAQARHAYAYVRVQNNGHIIRLRQQFWETCVASFSERLFRTDLPR